MAKKNEKNESQSVVETKVEETKVEETKVEETKVEETKVEPQLSPEQLDAKAKADAEAKAKADAKAALEKELKDLDEAILQAKAAKAKADAEEDYERLAACAKDLSALRAQRVDLAVDVALDDAKFQEAANALSLVTWPEGRFVVAFEIVDGVAKPGSRLKVAGPMKAQNQALQHNVTSATKANLNVNVTRGAGDKRHAPQGWTTQWSFKKIGQTFNLESLGGGSYHLTGGGRDVKGSGSQVLKSVTGYEMDFYINTGLGKAGFVWTDEHGLANGWKAPVK